VSVSSFSSIYVERNLPLLVTSASDFPLRTIIFCSLIFSSSGSSMRVVIMINKIHWCVVVCAVNCTARWTVAVVVRTSSSSHWSIVICPESRFFPTPPEFDAHVREVPVGILPWRLVLKKT